MNVMQETQPVHTIPEMQAMKAMHGKKGLVVGIANDNSIAWGCARALHAAGAELAITWLGDKARPHVQPLADISCHSFARMARLAEPLMQHGGGSLLTMSYLGGAEVMDNNSLMGPVKAALESTVRYLAAELGPRGIRVNAISPGPMATRAASGLADFDDLLDDAARRAPLRRLVDLDDVGAVCSFLASDAARSITGTTLYVDAGYHILN